jgi:HlyD family secretion protein
MRVSRYVRYSLGVAMVGALAAVAMWPTPTSVDVAPLTRGPMQVTIDEDGETRVRDRFVISAPVAGRLQRIDVEPGDRVGRGVVARLAPVDAPLLDERTRAELRAAADAARQAVGQARAERGRVAATLARATKSAERSAGLVEAGAVSREEDETAQTAMTTAAHALQVAELAIVRAEREHQAIESRLATPAVRGTLVDVLSPIEGVVLKRIQESECVVRAGEPLLEIADRANLEVVADLLSTDAVRVHVGAPVSIEGWGGDHPIKGRVRLVEPAGFLKISALGVEEQRVNVVIDFENPAVAAAKLGDGYRVEARIDVWHADDVVKVPVGSLFRVDKGWAVFVDDGGRARLRVVDIGERNNEFAELKGGVASGDQVVLHPPDTLEDGARIRIRR